MFNTIVALLLFIPGSLFASNATTPSYIIQLDGAQLLERDLTRPLPENELSELKTFFQKASKQSKKGVTRKDEIHMALGLLEIQDLRPSQAIKQFGKVPATSPLSEYALFYLGKAHRLAGISAEEKRKWTQSHTHCFSAKRVFQELSDRGSEIFPTERQHERNEAHKCWLRSLVHRRHYTEAYPYLLQIIQENSELTPEELEWFLLGVVRSLKAQKRNEEAQLLIENYVDRYPTFSRLKKERRKTANAPEETNARRSIPSEVQKRVPMDVKLPEDHDYEKLIQSLRRKKWSQATRRLVSLFKKYPGSEATQRAEGLLPSLLSSLIHENALSRTNINRLKDLPSLPLYSIAKTLWTSEKHDEAAKLLEHLIDRDPASSKASNALYVLARIQEDKLEWKDAREYYQQLVQGYSASSFYLRSRFKLPWLSYLLGDYKEAIHGFEQELALSKGPRYEGQALYWMAKAYDGLNQPKKAQELRDRLAQNAPLTYYAVLIQRLPHIEKVPFPPIKTPKNFWSEQSLQKAMSLMAAGLPQEAAKVLQTLRTNDPGLKRRIAQLFQIASNHPPAISQAYRDLIGKGSPPLPLHLMELFFPVEHEHLIQKEATEQGLDPILIQSLIKQESAYKKEAVSRAGALGLMQLMPRTARNVAKKNKHPLQSNEEILESETNILLGTRYLAEILKRFDGNLVYALASYNAGPNRVASWVEAWKSLPTDVFVELMPLDETRNYVKSIVRNRAFYTYLRTLNKNQLPESDVSTARP